MIRISATSIEQFRRVIQTEYGSEAELIAQIKGKPFVASAAMAAGTAWHAILETPSRFFVSSGYKCNGCHFRTIDVEGALAFLGPGTWEVKATKVYPIAGKLVTVVAQADHVNGKAIQDNKLSVSGLDVKRYEPSLQWRLYLDIHAADAFTYHRWQFVEGAPDFLELRDHAMAPFYRYPRLEQDCLAWITMFLDWAESRQLLGYLARPGSSITAESV